MTSTDRNDLVPAQEKLEWVTPKISLMDAGDIRGGRKERTHTRELVVAYLTRVKTIGPS